MIDLVRKLLGLGSYEAANFSSKRSAVPSPPPTDGRKELTPSTRRELVRRSRYLAKNSGFTREMVADMAIYSTGDGIRPQAQSDDPEWNEAAESYFKRWANRPEITNRFSFEECQSLICRGVDVDGEYFVLKVRDRFGRARIQLVESHRIGTTVSAGDFVDGISYDAYGAPESYLVVEDDRSERPVPATSVMHVFEPEQASAARAHPTGQHSINHILDEMELLALEKLAVKDNSDVSRVVKTESGTLEDEGDFKVLPDGSPSAENTDIEELRRILGGKVVGLKPHESMESFQSNRPSPVFTGFLEHLKRDSSAGILPYEFVLDPSKVGGAAVRLIVAKADRRFSYRQLILVKRFLRPTWGWVIGDAIDRGELPPVKKWNQVAWVTPRRITVDAGREAQQNRADVEAGLKTLEDHFAELGMDFREELEKRAQNAKAILDAARKYGVPVEMLWKSGAPPSSPPPAITEDEEVDRNRRE